MGKEKGEGKRKNGLWFLDSHRDDTSLKSRTLAKEGERKERRGREQEEKEREIRKEEVTIINVQEVDQCVIKE